MDDNALTIAYAIFLVGIGLLAFTFISAYIFLINNQPITGSSDLVDTFGDALAPLIGASIRIMFLGVMGWISSILTARGVQLITQLRRIANHEAQLITPAFEKVVGPTESKKIRKSRKS
jgi:peptidoglycan biosynthesis protein MviN/MurJ (putative lipid II flippase)